MDNSDIIGRVRAEQVRFVRLQFVDIFGHLKNVSVPARELPRILEGGCMFDGSSIDGFVRIEESDMFLRPDSGSFSLFPWRRGEDRVARLICDVCAPDGKPFAGDPRHVLKRALDRAAGMGYSFQCGPEMEFFLFETDAGGNPTTLSKDRAGYFDFGPADLGESARRDICVMLEEMGFCVEASHHECAPAQHEIDFRYNEGLRVADDVVTFKMIAKSVARDHGLYATFMPKPVPGVAGSGMHINMSLSKNGSNAFYDPTSPDGLSGVARSFVAGLMEHAEGLTAVTNPLVNSYKRLVPGFEAPCYVAWSDRNRSPLIRVPVSRGEGTRVELRSPDPSCNPYLALAVCLTAGLDGVERGLAPPPPINRNIYDMDLVEREDCGIRTLPRSLSDALRAMRADAVVMEALGGHIAEKFYEAKRREWTSYRAHVTDWEIGEYLRNY